MLNGAQTTSLVGVMAAVRTGELSENQAVRVISTSIGITPEEARAIIRGEV